MVEELELSKKAYSPKVSETVKSVINDFAEDKESIVINNINPNYVPYVIDKILEKSKKVIVLDNEEKLVDKYKEKFEKYLLEKNKLTIYSLSGDNPFRSNKNVSFHSLDKSKSNILADKNIRNFIIGDRIRFFVEKSQQFNGTGILGKFIDGIASVLGLDKKINGDVEYQTLIDFSNRSKASKFLKVLYNTIR